MNHPINEMNEAQRERLKRRIQRFFGAYYKKLRAEIARRETEAKPAPPHLKTYRKIVTYFCRDGVIVAHQLPDEGAQDDTYEFLVSNDLVKEIADRYNQPLLGGEKPAPLIEDYPVGTSFQSCIYPDPRQFRSTLTGGEYITQQDKWGRIDLVNLRDLGHSWRYEAEARKQAQERADHYLA
jgi:hypothetical protein